MSKVLQRGLLVLEALADHPGDVGVTELSRSLRISKATVYRFLDALVKAGYVEQDPAGNRYRLTSRLHQISTKLSAPRSIMEAAYPVMRRLVEKTGETSYLAVLIGSECVFLDKVDSEHPLRVHTTSGGRFPLHVGAASKVLLAYQTNADVLETTLRNLTAVTRYTITSRTRLLKQLEEIRRDGYAISEREWREGISGVSAPVRNAAGVVVAALAVSGPSSRLPLTKLHEMAADVVKASDRLSMFLGWTPRAAAGKPTSAGKR